MKDIHTQKRQKIRLANLFLAELGALVLSLIVGVAYYFDLFLAPLQSLIIVFCLFWLVNISVFIIMISGANLKFKDPAFSLPQMYWATITSLFVLVFTRHCDGILYLLVMLSTVFGILKVSKPQFVSFCIFQNIALITAHTARYFVYGEPEPHVVVLSWIAFAFCSATLASLCTSIVNLRSRLKENNASLSEALQVKSRFLATMSHEIRTPMNGVIGMLDVAILNEENKEKKNYLNVAYSSAQSLLAIINDILSFSKVDQAKVELDITATNIEETLNQSALLFSPIAEKNNVSIFCHIDMNLPEYINTDKSKLTQVVNNLVNNAVKFTSAGHVLIQAKKYDLTSTGETAVEISVKDTGIGITTEQQQAIFEPFTQADSTTTRLYGGTGLGLCIADRLVRAMGSKISLQSKEKEGSTFKFLLGIDSSATDSVLKNSYAQPYTFTQAFLYSQYSPLSDVILSDIHDLHLGLDTCPLTSQKFIDKARRYASSNMGQGARAALVVVALNNLDDTHVPQNCAATYSVLSKINRSRDTAIPILIIGKNNHCSFSDIPLSFQIPSYYSTEQLFDALNALSEMHYPVKPDAVPAQKKIPLVEKADDSATLLQNGQSQTRYALIVDDNAINLEVAKLIIEPLGFIVDVANDGRDALEKLAQCDPDNLYDIIFMDCQMPVMDGYEATKAIRNDHAYDVFKHTPIIAITANAMPGDKEKCLACGMNDYVAKPIQSHIVEKIVSQWVNIQTFSHNKNSHGTHHKLASEEPTTSLNCDTKYWDEADLVKLVGGNHARVKRLLDSFIPGLDAVEKEAITLCENKQWEALKNAMHTLKGSAGNMRMSAIAELATQIDDALKTSQTSQVPTLLKQLVTVIKATKEDINRRIL